MQTRIVSGTRGMALTLVFLPLWATAEELSPIGRWKGTIDTPKQSRVSYTVEKGPNITMHWQGHDFVFKKLALKDDKLTFTLELAANSKYQCILTKAPSQVDFAGDCTSNRDTMQLSMRPK